MQCEALAWVRFLAIPGTGTIDERQGKVFKALQSVVPKRRHIHVICVTCACATLHGISEPAEVCAKQDSLLNAAIMTIPLNPSHLQLKGLVAVKNMPPSEEHIQLTTNNLVILSPVTVESKSIMSSDSRAALLKASTPPSDMLFSTLITANHILHQHAVLDAYGHISVRNPQNPATFFVSRSLAPALVTSRDDIEEYYVENASSVNKNAPQGYAERFIHSEIYKRYADVNSVIHSHSEAVIPFSISSVPLRPVYHMAGTLGSQIPVYDIALHYKSSDTEHSLLVDQPHLGAALAAGFNPGTLVSKTTNLIKNYITSSQPQPTAFPSSPVVLMRGHGFSCVAHSIEEAVFRAIYTCSNARIQTTALLMQGGYNVGLLGERFGAGEKETGPAKREEIKFLNEREVRDTSTRLQKTIDRPWELWCAEVADSNLYRNAYLDDVEADNEGEDADEEEHER